MEYDPAKHHRRSIRLKGYDYAQAGAYFVTICVQERECVLGEVVDGQMRLNDWGYVAEECWGWLTDLARIHEYIQNNPARWTDDQLHPDAPPNPFNRG